MSRSGSHGNSEKVSPKRPGLLLLNSWERRGGVTSQGRRHSVQEWPSELSGNLVGVAWAMSQSSWISGDNEAVGVCVRLAESIVMLLSLRYELYRATHRVSECLFLVTSKGRHIFITGKYFESYIKMIGLEVATFWKSQGNVSVYSCI